MSIAEKLQTIAENEQKVYDAGKKTEYDKFWDTFQQNGKKTNYANAFYSSTMADSGWNDNTYNPKYPIVHRGGGANVFWCNMFTDTKVPITLGDGVSAQNLFGSCKNLVTVQKLILEGTVSMWSNAFIGCKSLENITIEGEVDKDIDFKSCSKLTNISITNIIDSLSPTVSGKTVTFSNTAVTNAFGGSDSEEWLNLIATKSNWTIDLV